jgi:TrpR-related protein YerC/YecD
MSRISLRFLSVQDRGRLLTQFAEAIGIIKNPIEAAYFIKDIFSEQEVIMLARRLQIANLLLEGNTYEQIQDLLSAGHSTISKVHYWLSVYGDGYRLVLKKLPKDVSESFEENPWRQFKRKYPMYFWPQELLKEIIKSANKRQKDRLRKVLSGLSEKTKLIRSLEKLIAKNR